MIQLRVRTEYTFGATFAPINRVVERLKEIGCTAAGIVDEDSTWGHVQWHQACRDAGIKPILGVSIAVNDDDSPTKMWFLARNADGLGEMYGWTSKAHLQPIKTRSGRIPRLFRDDVRKMSENILKFAGDCADGEFLREIGAAIDVNPASRILNARKLALAEETGLPCIETSDNAYAYEDDKDAFEFVSKAALKPSPQHLLAELDYQHAARALADSCDDYELPRAPMIRADGDLEALCRDGIKIRKMKWTQEYEDRLRYELELIRSKDFDSYFIIVADMVRYAKRHMLVGPSRGSAAGSLVCYLTQITEIDPLPPKLFFERFIDADRKDLPDIDLDFPDDKRHIVFEYMAEKYGVENVAHIGTISRFKPKSALIQVCKALGIPPHATAAVKASMIVRSIADSRANNCLLDTLETTRTGQEFLAAYPQAKIATELEGHASHTGVHAAGLLMCNDPIIKYCTVDENGIAHIDKGAAEALGLLKIDVLGLRTLGVLEDAGVDVDWYNLPIDDAKTYDIFNSNNLCGIFQFEGEAMRTISRRVDFGSISDVDAVTALARPGPFIGGVTEKYLRRRAGEIYNPLHPLVEAQMTDTYGLPLYQEQTMAIVREIGKFSWKETSIIRKAVSKRLGQEFFDTLWGIFKKGAMSQGISEQSARETWEMINAMGAWQMNKAHTYSYAVISYWTAYLKAHYPLEFAAANLRSAKNEESATALLREMVKEGMRYVPFDIEKSQADWSVQDGVLYGGFKSLHGIGDAKAAKLVAARDAGALTPKQREFIAEARSAFADIFPFRTRYGHLYDDPEGNNIASPVVHIVDILENVPRHNEERVFIGELIHKNPRDENEEIRVKKRGGKIVTGKTVFLDVRLRDDTAAIGGRIGRFDYERIGRELYESMPIGAHIMVRAKFFNNLTYAFITKWRRLDV